MKISLKLATALLLLPAINDQLSIASAQGTGFTYQGRLNDGANPANGIYDLRFAIYDAASAGTQQGVLLTNSATAISNGLFTVTLDFGNQFPGADRWLEIAVRTNGNGAFTTLTPRQPLTPTPYAVRALTASNLVGTVSATQISGNVDAVTLDGVGSAGFWKTNGNAGANPANGAFIGTSDVLPLEFKVNSQRALRLEPNINVPNVIGGSEANMVTNGNYGALIAGGGSTSYPNRVGGVYASVLGGAGNTASGLAATAMGQFNNASGYASTASGYSTAAGGFGSFAAGTQAKANHDGAFVWADQTFLDFSSTANNQFLIRAAGGVGINTNNPNGAALAVNGNLTVSGTLTVPAGQFVKSVNGQTDAVTLTAGNGLSLANNQFSLKPGTLLVNDTVSQYAFKSKAPGGYWSGPVGLWGDGGTDSSVTPTVPCGVYGTSGDGSGVFGTSKSTYIYCAGVAGTGFGTTIGVSGRSDSGYAVKGVTGGSGSAIYGENINTSGFAGDFNGNVRITGKLVGSYLNVTGAGNEQAYMGGDGAGGDVEIGSRNAAIMNVGFWNSAAGSHMNLYCLAVNPTSDRNAKENFTALNARAVLEKVAALPLTEWNYKADTATKHIGPMAQDFHAAFGVGPDDKHIATVDADGVALAAIQGLNEKVEAGSQESEIRTQKLEADNSELKKQVAELKALVESLAAKMNGGAR